MERRGRRMLPAALAVGLAGAGLMLGLFGAGESSFAPLETLPPPVETVHIEHEETEGLIDINTAGLEELDTLPGIGPVKAAAIIAWREEHGPFRYPEDLLQVSGIGEKTLEGLIDKIKVGGE